MKKFYYLFLFLSLIACRNQPKDDPESDKADEITQSGKWTTTDHERTNSDERTKFTEDNFFKETHDQPDTIELSSNGNRITFPTPDSLGGIAFAIFPNEPTKKYLFVFHEWWGLNDHILQEAQRLFDELDNVAVLALDLYDGQTTADQDKVEELMQAVTQERAEAIIQGALAYAGEEAEIGTIGWCFGGGWSLRASIMAGERGIACVLFYGMPVQNEAELAPIEADILGIFAQNDTWITPEIVTNFENLAKAVGKDIEIQQFDADHAFANPGNPHFDAEAAQRANALALDFLKDRL